jgi:hypothetical protein
MFQMDPKSNKGTAIILVAVLEYSMYTGMDHWLRGVSLLRGN